MPKINIKPRDMVRAVEKGDWKVIDKFVAQGGDINSNLRKTGPQAGYTALHFAILNEDRNSRIENTVEKLITNYGADVNCMGADGAQPIHLACLRQNYYLNKILLKSGADPNAVISKEIFDKYSKISKLFSYEYKWSDEFGKMTLFVFNIINLNHLVLGDLVDYKANIEITGKNNKTLLMYGVEKNSTKYLEPFAKDSAKCKPEFLNARDDYGRHAVHYLLPNEQFGEFRYLKDTYISNLVWELRKAGADINAMIDNDPDTLLINKVAYRCCESTLEDLLELRYPFPAKGRPLHYFMIPVNPEKFVEDPKDREKIEKARNRCLKFILENYTLRREFGFVVPEEEIELMNKLITQELKVKKIVDDFKEQFINTLLIVPFSENLTLYDLVVKVFNKGSLKMLVKNDKLVEDYDDFFLSNFRTGYDKFWLFNAMYCKIQKTYKRWKIMEKVEKISQLKKAIPLPYEIILMIIEYIDDDNLKNFVNSFYKNPICE